ncbi:UDP-glucose 4-epimerase GalE [Iamia sp.]|uniref:UDP-glucose 4-epimerase GalE n=1 Tax=Iamia sp. TaxID=2722710 RepID=UPI002BC17C06|nr:UDP-glucose 4-epimerase GalE [Iamia sp.]HXH57837.1 UDP-glucose 4-epimerase GalE [Iamia sp.]
MTVLVTGGAGYIGSHTVALLRQRGRDVVIYDSLELGRPEATLGAPLVVGDIADAELVKATVAEHGVDAVIHFAAYKAAGESMEQPGRYFANNVAKTNTFLDAAREVGVPRIVFSSSCSVYGTPTCLPVDETHPLAPESPYAESKRMVEDMLRWYSVAHDLRSVSLRYFNAAGAAASGLIGEDWTVTLNLVPLVMKAALGRVPQLTVFGTDYPTRDGTGVRDYVHVDDLADAHVRALEYLEAGGETTAVNLGTGVGSTVREVLDCAREVSGVDIPSLDAPRRPGDPAEVYGDNRRAHELLGWRADRNLSTIMASAWQWHSTHPDGYDAAT